MGLENILTHICYTLHVYDTQLYTIRIVWYTLYSRDTTRQQANCHCVRLNGGWVLPIYLSGSLEVVEQTESDLNRTRPVEEKKALAFTVSY